MNEPVMYGQLQSEKVAEENLVCRQIVQEISRFGITQRQTLLLIYLLALELENVEKMQTVTSIVKEIGGTELFISTAEKSNGTIDV